MTERDTIRLLFQAWELGDQATITTLMPLIRDDASFRQEAERWFAQHRDRLN